MASRKAVASPALPRLVDEYLREIQAARGASPHTLRAYRGDLDSLLEFLTARDVTDPRAVDARALRAFLATLDEQGLSRTSIQRRLSAVRSFFRHLLRQRKIDAHPAQGLRAARVRRPLPRALEVAEVERLLASPDVEQPLGRRDRALLECMYSAGTRAAEVVGLDRGDLDLRRGVARVKGKGRNCLLYTSPSPRDS